MEFLRLHPATTFVGAATSRPKGIETELYRPNAGPKAGGPGTRNPQPSTLVGGAVDFYGVMRDGGCGKNFVGEVCSQHIVFDSAM